MLMPLPTLPDRTSFSANAPVFRDGHASPIGQAGQGFQDLIEQLKSKRDHDKSRQNAQQADNRAAHLKLSPGSAAAESAQSRPGGDSRSIDFDQPIRPTDSNHSDQDDPFIESHDDDGAERKAGAQESASAAQPLPRKHVEQPVDSDAAKSAFDHVELEKQSISPDGDAASPGISEVYHRRAEVPEPSAVNDAQGAANKSAKAFGDYTGMHAPDDEHEADTDAESDEIARQARRAAVGNESSRQSATMADPEQGSAIGDPSRASESSRGAKAEAESGWHRVAGHPRSANAQASMTGEAVPYDEPDDAAQPLKPHERGAGRKAPTPQEPRLPESRDSRLSPAMSRAQYVEAAIRLENATGQPVTSEHGARVAVGTIQPGAGGDSANLAGEGDTQNLPSRSAGPEDSRFSSRVIRGLTAMINQRGGTMTMRLDPPDLGQLRVQMTLARGVVSAQFTASTPQARALLERNMVMLRTALEGQGLTVERLSVQTQQTSSQQGSTMNDEAIDREQSNAQHDAAGGESRGRREASNEDAQESKSRGAKRDFASVIEWLEETSESRQ